MINEPNKFLPVIVFIFYFNYLSGQCSTPINISNGKSVSMSSWYNSNSAYTATKAIDGDINSFTHTEWEQFPWWSIDLGSVMNISSIAIMNRVACCLPEERLKNFKIFISNTEATTTYSTSNPDYTNTTVIADGATVNVNLPAGKQGRYISIIADFTITNYPLSLAEFTVMGCDVTSGVTCPLVSQSKTSGQSSTLGSYSASLANDGNITNFNHTNTETNPYWYVNLGSSHTISKIEIKNREGCQACADEQRLKNFKVFVSSSSFVTNYNTANHVFESTTPRTDGEIIIINTSVIGQYVSIVASNSPAKHLHLAEVKVYGCTAGGGTTPSTPTNLTATPISSSQIDLSWSAVSGATYNLERSTTSATSGFTSLATGISATSYSNTGLNASTTYWYRVAAVNASGTSALSTAVSATTSAGSGGGGSSQWTGTTAGIYYNSHVHIGKANTNTGEAGYSLFVRGGIKTEKIKVEIPSTSGANGWADYVFKPDYKLLPIKQLEKFIKTNNHLPGFPSEKSIFLNGGYEMSDMIRRQQASIEELHLYIIELENRIKQLENREKESNLNKN